VGCMRIEKGTSGGINSTVCTTIIRPQALVS
jgi:hypothetical protein